MNNQVANYNWSFVYSGQTAGVYTSSKDSSSLDALKHGE